jgi:hypothetical protein
MRTTSSLTYLSTVVAAFLSPVGAQSWNDIPEIEIYGQHFFYTNNGSQLYGYDPLRRYHELEG